MSAAWIDDSLAKARTDDSIDGPFDEGRLPNPEPNEISDEAPLVKLIRNHDRAATPNPPSAEATTKTIPKLTVGVLTTDSGFLDQLRAALEDTSVVAVDTLEAADQLVECPIVVTDLATTRAAIETLTQRVRARDPATVMILAGTRDESSRFIALQSSGVIDAFLLKPVTTAATQLVMEAATRRYRGTDGKPKPQRKARHVRPKRRILVPAEDLESSETIEGSRLAMAPQHASLVAPQTPPSKAHPSWTLIAAIAIVAAGAIAWAITPRTSGIDPSTFVTKHLALAESALAAGRLLDTRDGAAQHYQTVLAIEPTNLAAQRGLDSIAQALSRQTQAHMTARELPDAVLTLTQLRELKPDYAELPLLETQLQQLQDSFAAMHIAKQEPPPAAPASRVLPVPRKAVPPVRLETPPATGGPSSEETVAANPSLPSQSEAVTASDTTLPATRNELAVDTPGSAIESPLPSEVLPEEASSPPLVESSRDELVASLNRPSPVTAPATDTPREEPATRSPKLVKYVAPEFPAIARDRGITGWVMLSLEVAPDGRVLNARIEDAVRRQIFGKAALAAVREWQYEPDATRLPGERTKVRVEFKLE
jgi:protein TonB